MNQELRQKIHEFIEKVPVPGVAIAIYKDGISQEFIGKRNKTEEFNKDTLIEQASLTKGTIP